MPSMSGFRSRGGPSSTRSLQFFHFGHQCPHNAHLLARIQSFAKQEGIPLRVVDVSRDEDAGERFRIFSPNMLLVNEKYRLHGPYSWERVKTMIDDEDIEPEAYGINQSEDVVRGSLVPLTSQSVLSTCWPCMGSEDERLCKGKSEWVATVTRSLGLEHLGYLHFYGGRCVGGAEFLPSESVPYPIPDKRKDNAFLTCSFVSDEKKDYKTYPMTRMIDDLGGLGFNTLSVAASRDVVFPNGPLEWFLKKGFADGGVLITEVLHKAEIHYLQLRLNKTKL